MIGRQVLPAARSATRGLPVAAPTNLPATTPGYVSDLNTPLLMFSEHDVWTLRDAAEGVFVTGGIGSGKSSGSGSMLAKSYLRSGFGGVVCCANIDEVDRWRRYCAETGRERSLIVVDKSLAHHFNFLEYQMTVGRGSTFEAVAVLLEILKAAAADGGGEAKEDFWNKSMRELLSRSLAPLWAAYGRVTLADLMRFIRERPLKVEQLDDEGDFVKTSFWAKTMELAIDGDLHPMDEEDYDQVWGYWTSKSEMMAEDQRTAGNIVKTLTAQLEPFLTGDLRKLFCTHSTFVPELTFEGAVIVLDLSAHDWGQEGIFAQHIVKVMWQKAIQRRPKTPDARPCFLFADECQYFLVPSDQPFASTARACRALTVYLTQNLPGIYAKIGGARAQDVTDALLGNLATKIFHAQPDYRTAEWAANMIGKALTWRENVGENTGYQTGTNSSSGSSSGAGPATHSHTYGTSEGSSFGSSHGASQVVDYRLQPSHFTTLTKGGGPERASGAVIFQAGRVFAYTGSTWTPALFPQS